MENTAKKKANEKKGKKKTDDVKERILSGRPVLCFDEEIDFDKCGPVSAEQIDDTTENKKKKAGYENVKNASLDSIEIGTKKKGSKKTKEGKEHDTHRNSNDQEKIHQRKGKKKGTGNANSSNGNDFDDEDGISIYKNVDKHGASSFNEDYVFNEVDSTTNSSSILRIQRNNIELKKKGSSKFIKLQSNNNGEVLNKENNEQLNKWIETLPSINSEIGILLNNHLPCYRILDNIKRINKIKSVVYNDNENDEMLNTIEKSNIMFNSIKLTTKEKYIIRFLCEGSSHTLSELVELLFYVLNNEELVLDRFPIKIAPTSDKEGGNVIFSLNQANNSEKGEENNISLSKDNENDESRENECNISMDNFSDEEYYSDDGEKKNYNIHISREDLLASIPILLSRKSLGDNMKKMNVSKNENNEKECLWVWENDNYELFPPYYKEIFKYFKEFRNNQSKIYRTLIKLKNSILSKDLQSIVKTHDYLNELKKKQYLESEKRCKKILIEKKKIIKRKMDIKKQEEKKKKIEDAKFLEEKKAATINKLDSVVAQNKTEEKKPKQQNLILSWLTMKKNEKANSANSNENSEQFIKYPIANVLSFNEALRDKLMEAQNQLPIFTCNRKGAIGSSSIFKSNGNFDKQKLLEDYEKMCGNHKRTVVDYFKVYVDNKEFFEEIPSVDSIDGSKLIVQNEKGVRSKLWEDNEFYCKLKNSEYIRSFYFYDNSWTRPYMSLLVHKVLDDNINLLPYYYNDDMEYENDTNEDYYEKFETIDLTTENEENETESDGSSQDMFIVPDNELNTDINITPITIPTSQDIHFFSLFNWEWKFEGNPKRNYDIINKNTWKEFNLIYKENIYGCQYMSWGKENNPFIYLSERNSPKNTLNNYDIKKLIKHSHGKVTKKDVLVDQFKLKNEHLTKADTERKFKTYLVYKKCEDNRKKWMASEEGIKLFKNEQLLTKIYNIRKRKLNLITQKMEQVKRQKRMDRENLKKEEKIKRKEKSNQEKLLSKDNMKKEAVKDPEKLEKKETMTKEATNIIQKIFSSSSLTGSKNVKK
ncbi:conserved Plasmodium protein, unknown function [Plasmodium knowlesi strain H]|uniref:Uncharacterized protein n=3 Tax=Plasmodium knowlesi TaxID=5850 RepID=A0A5K1V8R5_PLAKH|nr:conserved Plasmodium protein, unknown function [Plasmodium knowlesi strain H]OTN64144.1 Uncharacterized protein PKNOH_S140238000 [Plasmodium knowlesi]CAA9990802.1 conserved Plasmodium protein, unknown function [Plasmodium knowlesi strain H]SBO21043.1 conserved Plasmodium protein, unknown function [Plasmodium knowlesi strain H]SBO21531.1 conserved Plasmodium protein, unknown function [Plasmodium knowlesi strain H]VVS80276.1 conserved Plasmodium protein, unknown function [Plasmodium knowlesi |eukprot:XP_002262090.1 hypothetical protein, conserved in Plasmodium species [Plasmodium knowlesi strain H]